jgi:hypothetical protein
MGAGLTPEDIAAIAAAIDDCWDEHGEPVSLPPPSNEATTTECAYTELELRLSAIASEE